MKIAIIGYGRMGKTVHELAEKAGHEIIVTIDNEDEWKQKEAELKKADMAIEFSTPGTVVENIGKCFKLNIPAVVGTTAWDDHLDRIRQECLDGKHSLFVASNFSIGVNIFFRVNRYLAKLMDHFGEYDPEIEEIHHAKKLDAPSGTARVIANDIIGTLSRKKSWTLKHGSKADEISIHARREGDVKGTHKVFYKSGIDEIEIAHVAKSRHGFTRGAIRAAEWLNGKSGFFTMDDLFDDII